MGGYVEAAVLDYSVVEELARRRRRAAARLSLLLRAAEKPRGGGRRSLRDARLLAELAVEASKEMLEVVAWGGARGERRLRLKP